MKRATWARALHWPRGRGPPCAHVRSVRRRSRSLLRCFSFSPVPAVRRRRRPLALPAIWACPHRRRRGHDLQPRARMCGGHLPAGRQRAGDLLVGVRERRRLREPRLGQQRELSEGSNAPPPPRWGCMRAAALHLPGCGAVDARVRSAAVAAGRRALRLARSALTLALSRRRERGHGFDAATPSATS